MERMEHGLRIIDRGALEALYRSGEGETGCLLAVVEDQLSALYGAFEQARRRRAQERLLRLRQKRRRRGARSLSDVK